MIERHLSQAAATLQTSLNGADAVFRGVSTDSRSLAAGELFVALQGPNFDGAGFAQQVAEKGAAGIVTQSEIDADLPSIKVSDTHAALGQLAADWRAEMPARVIGLTGSNGKTTLKEMLASCLRPIAPTLATAGNLNNDIGLPLMLLRMSPEDQYAVLEMGANHAGEIAYLTQLAVPSIVAINNAGPAHLEGFGSQDGVAHAKGEILQGRQRPETAVLNADDRYFELWCSMAADLDIVSFGYSARATISVDNVQATAHGSQFDLKLPTAAISIKLPLPGAHNVMNACAAAAVAHAAGLSGEQIQSGLQAALPVDGRLQPLPGKQGIRLFDDSYNANPTSVLAAAQFVAAQPGKSCMILGDMGELGSDEVALHRAVGADIRAAGVDQLLASGPLSQHAVAAFGSGGRWFASVADLLDEIQGSAIDAANVLVKGSRYMRMERVVDALRAPTTNDGGH